MLNKLFIIIIFNLIYLAFFAAIPVIIYLAGCTIFWTRFEITQVGWAILRTFLVIGQIVFLINLFGNEDYRVALNELKD